MHQRTCDRCRDTTDLRAVDGGILGPANRSHRHSEPIGPAFNDNVYCIRDHHATLLPLLGPPPPLDLFLSLVLLELALEFSAPPSVSPRCLLTSGFAGLTSRGLFVSCILMYQQSSIFAPTVCMIDAVIQILSCRLVKLAEQHL